MDDTLIYISYVLTVIILVIVPGADTVMFMKALITGGRRYAFRLSLGVIAGCACWGGIVLFGISDFIYTSEKGYNAIRWLGAGYLLYLAAKTWMEPIKISTTTVQDDNTQESAWFFRGLISNMLNPKVGLFYIAILPSFIPSRPIPKLQTLSLITIHLCLYFIWTIILLTLAARLIPILNREDTRRKFDRAISLLFVFLALNLLFGD